MAQKRKRTIEQRWTTAANLRYVRIVKAQGGGCAICGTRPEKVRRLAADHDHETGQKRGYLCTACNVGLGLFKDNPHLFLSALDYLAEYGIELK